MAKAWQDEQNATNCVGADAALSPLHLPVAAPAGRKTAGFFSIPFKHWHGRLEKLPVELQQIFLPRLQPDLETNLESLQRGKIQRAVVFVPQIGALTLQLKDHEIWATFMDAHQWACLGLQFRRRFVLALRYRTFVRSPEGGMWVWLPRQVVFPPDFCPTLWGVVCQTSLLERSPPFWKRNDNLYRETDEVPLFLTTNLWFDASKPRAQRAPTRAARLAWRVAG